MNMKLKSAAASLLVLFSFACVQAQAQDDEETKEWELADGVSVTLVIPAGTEPIEASTLSLKLWELRRSPESDPHTPPECVVFDEIIIEDFEYQPVNFEEISREFVLGAGFMEKQLKPEHRYYLEIEVHKEEIRTYIGSIYAPEGDAVGYLMTDGNPHEVEAILTPLTRG